jgi:hypothetical protein
LEQEVQVQSEPQLQLEAPEQPHSPFILMMVFGVGGGKPKEFWKYGLSCE